ncbi:trehalase family glycosidase [Ruegeria sp. HKCCC1038]|uniref:MGH1-like glycoside hydrolase domain-containing protein n=1 Tax=Ruegeria sp. HKCCC1038 TaxID=2682982 RepID=UPI001489E9AE|nr:trehalase family glycosidase [Ruegeria sp. HKCCC1038]
MIGDAFGWGTWTAERPAEFFHLETGLQLTTVLYSDRAESATDLPPSDQIRYGHRGIRNGLIEFTTSFEDTELDWTCDRYGDALDLSWICRSNGEWGLRYWVCLCLSAPSGAAVDFDPETGAITMEGSAFSAECKHRPLLVTAHDDAAGLIDELETNGYFYLGSRSTKGRFLALRFNLDETPQMSIKLDIGESERVKSAPSPKVESALQAVHDVLAWNHVFDPVNKRPYTALTRNWSARKFGGFGVWLNDILFHGLLWSLLDPSKSRENVEAVFAHQTEAGNFPCLVTGNDAWLDRSQLPMASYVIWAIYRATGDLAFLKWAYPKLMANHRWWWRNRALADTGLVAYGTSKGPGDGLYKGTKLAARNESAMDNMAVHDEAEFDPETGLMQSADVGLNSLLALDGEVLAAMAELLCHSEDFTELSDRTARHKAQIKEFLWDDNRSVFANRLTSGRFVEALAPTSFFPMVAGAAREDQVEALLVKYLRPDTKFGGTYALPSAPRDQPAYKDNTYWRGRVWAPLNFWVHQGLIRYERLDEARALAEKSLDMFNTHWVDRKCGENYSAVDGQINDQVDTDSFYTWGALLPALSLFQGAFGDFWSSLEVSR